MSTEIVVRFYFRSGGPPPDEVFCVLARTFAAAPQAKREFHGWRLLRADRHTVAEQQGDYLSSEDLCRRSKGKVDPQGLIATTSSFRCWRFSPENPAEERSVGVSLMAWGESWGKRNLEDHRVGGDAALSLSSCGPFVALLEQEPEPRRQEINGRVEENLQALSGLLLRAAEALQPSSMKVFTDQGLYLPFNAHFAYYREETAVLEDLQLIADVWERGLPAHNIAPLRQRNPDDMAPAFHHWRAPEGRERLWNELDAVLPSKTPATVNDIRAALGSGHFDSYEMPVGITVLDYPHYINSFLDRFFLEILERLS